MTGKIERGVPSDELAPGKIPRWHVRYSSIFFGPQNLTDKELELLRKEWEERLGVKAQLMVSDMGEVVIIFKERKLRATRGTPKTAP